MSHKPVWIGLAVLWVALMTAVLVACGTPSPDRRFAPTEWERISGNSRVDSYWVDRVITPAGPVICIHSAQALSCLKETQ